MQCIGSNTKLECNIKKDKAKTHKISIPKHHSGPCIVLQCSSRPTV